MRLFDVGAKDGPEVIADGILTVPNLLSFARLLILPVVYFDLAVDPTNLLRALILLSLFAATDWLDGYVARRFDQVTRLGKLLDPISDRLLIAIVGVALVVGDLVPLWAILVLVARDLLVLGGGGILMAKGLAPPPVTRTGKAATFGLMFAFPLFILASVVGDGPSDPHDGLLVLAWLTYAVNTGLYYAAAVQYARFGVRELRRPSEPPGQRPPAP